MLTHSKTVTTKRGNRKMTTYFSRGSTIWINYYVDGERKRKSTKLKDTPANVKIVKNQLIPALDAKIATGEIYKKKPNTFEYYGGIFLTQKDSNKSFWMRKSYYERVIDHFRGRDISTITRLDIKQYLASLDMKSQSKGTYKSCVKEIFELAVDDEVISTNPAEGIKLKGDEKPPIQFYYKEDVNKLLVASTGLMEAYLYTGFNTGMRPSEILGLQLTDFKDDGYIHIERTRSKGRVSTGKTKNAQRKVPYPRFILDKLKKIQAKDSIYIFGWYDDAAKLRYLWRDVLDAASVEKHKLSSTRHTFATLMLKDNIVSIGELAGLLGHSSPKVTLEHYASVIEAKNVDLGANFSLFCHDTDTIEKEESLKAL